MLIGSLQFPLVVGRDAEAAAILRKLAPTYPRFIIQPWGHVREIIIFECRMAAVMARKRKQRSALNIGPMGLRRCLLCRKAIPVGTFL